MGCWHPTKWAADWEGWVYSQTPHWVGVNLNTGAGDRPTTSRDRVPKVAHHLVSSGANFGGAPFTTPAIPLDL